MPRLFPKLTLLSFPALAVCEGDEDHSARFCQSVLALLEKGQVDQALVEFRVVVLAADPNHDAALLAYTDAERVRGNVADANSQYFKLIKQNPEDVAALIALSEIATLGAKWENAKTYLRAAAALRPVDPAVFAVIAMPDHHSAALAKEDAGRATASDMARKVLQQNPGNVIACKILIDNNILDGDIPNALAAVNAGLAIDHAQLELHIIRVGLLSGSGDTVRAQAALKDMAAQFPDNPDVR
jgi:predicted Zn-dependent protease